MPNPRASTRSTIRGDFAVEVGRNVIHGSDSVENGEREVALWMGKDNVVEWTQCNLDWLREVNRV